MKDLKLFALRDCPYCQRVFAYLAAYELPSDVNLRIIFEDEEKQLADSYDYYYVPSFFLNEVKIHEGALNEKDFISLMEKCR